MDIQPRNKKAIFFASLIAVTVITVICFIIFYSLNRKEKLPEVPQTTTVLESQFPLTLDPDFGYYSFICNFQNYVYDDLLLSNGYIISLAAECIYKDADNNEQKITIPLVIFNPNNNTWLIEDRIYENLEKYSDEDFISVIETNYYYERGLTNPIYDDPKTHVYWRKESNKPTIDTNDLYTVRIAKSSSILHSQDSLKNSAAFNQEYINSRFGDSQLDLFIQNGKLDNLKLEYDNLLVPTFTEFLKDQNPK